MPFLVVFCVSSEIATVVDLLFVHIKLMMTLLHFCIVVIARIRRCYRVNLILLSTPPTRRVSHCVPVVPMEM